MEQFDLGTTASCEFKYVVDFKLYIVYIVKDFVGHLQSGLAPGAP